MPSASPSVRLARSSILALSTMVARSCPSHPHRRTRSASFALLGLLALLSGCASSGFDAGLAQTSRDTAAFTQGQLQMALTPEQRSAMDAQTAQLLQKPLSMDEAVQLALLNHPAWQALLAEYQHQAAQTEAAARLPNPLLGFSRIRSGNALDIERSLSFGLLDLLRLPQRQQLAHQQQTRAQLALSSQVVAQVTEVRQAWVRAVAAQQALEYAQQVHESADASAELARRMLAAGNFSALAQSRQQVYFADAVNALTNAQHEQTRSREVLIRALGLSEAQAAQLQLPPRLPDMPAKMRSNDEVLKTAAAARLDVRMAQAEFEAAANEQGLGNLASLLDLELGLRRDTSFANEGGTASGPNASRGQGLELSLRLPLNGSASLQSEAMNAQTLAKGQRLQAVLRAAGSHLRESYSAYRSSYEIAQHYRQHILPLRQKIMQENVLRYNGMLAGVFDLLAEAREQVASVQAALQAEQQFWLSDAALQAQLIGQPGQAMATEPNE